MSAALSSLPRDLRVVAALAVLASAVSFLPIEPWLQFVVALPLILVLPGYAIGAALFPRRDLPLEETVVYAIAFSLAAVAIGGVLAQLVVALDRTTWSLLLTAITLAAIVVAELRRGTGQAGQPTVAALRPIGALATVLLLTAFGLAAWSVALATDGAHDQAAESRFSSLWIVPNRNPAVGGARVGVENEEGEDATYELLVREGDEEVGRWPIELADGESWQTVLTGSALSPPAAIAAELYRDGDLYRRAYLRPEEIR
jgi:hypothetical protein